MILSLGVEPVVMTSRWADMDARSSQRWSPRLLCVVAGLLCAVGVLSGGVLHISGGAHHHAHAVAAVVTLTDSHSTVLRGDHQSIATTAATATRTRVRTDLATTPSATFSPVTIDSVRTRGPPVSA
jgi:hypothetical protein